MRAALKRMPTNGHVDTAHAVVTGAHERYHMHHVGVLYAADAGLRLPLVPPRVARPLGDHVGDVHGADRVRERARLQTRAVDARRGGE